MMERVRTRMRVRTRLREHLGRLGLWRPRKVFAIGMNKSGTTSIHETFLELGLASYHGTEWRNVSNERILHRFNAFSDGPPSDFAVLDRLFPKSKFILNVREFDEWCLSRMKHIARMQASGWTPPTNSNWRIAEASVASWLTDRNTYHTRVMEYFRDRPEDLLVINFVRDRDAGQKIAEFLGGKKSVSRHFANSANGRGEDPAHKNLLDNVLAAHGLTTDDARNDILNLPSSESTPLPKDTSQLSA